MSSHRIPRAIATGRWFAQPQVPHGTLLPFLYYTSTIQAVRPLRRQPCPSIRQTRRYRPADQPAPDLYIPFEDELAKPEELEGPPERRSTMTDPERQAFRNLLGRIPTKPLSSDKPRDALSSLPAVPESEVEGLMFRIIKEWREGPLPVKRASFGMSPALAPLADALATQTERLQQKIGEASLEPVIQEQRREKLRIEELMRDAKYDTDLWQLLEKQVFPSIVDLEAQSQQQAVPLDGKRTHKLAMLGPIYPALLVTALRLFRKRFPRSTFQFNILPAVKALGRSSYILGASTTLYNEVMDLSWTTYADIQGVLDLLREMENGGIGFDIDTLAFVDSVHSEATRILDGERGVGLSHVFGMSRYVRGLAQLEEWRNLIEGNLTTERSPDDFEP